jgi:hypothetical protein
LLVVHAGGPSCGEKRAVIIEHRQRQDNAFVSVINKNGRKKTDIRRCPFSYSNFTQIGLVQRNPVYALISLA